MATVKPFRAIRPQTSLAEQICELPYDVLSSSEARSQAADNPLSFFYVSKPEIDLPEDTDPYSDQVYKKGAQRFQALREQGALFSRICSLLLSLSANHGGTFANGFGGILLLPGISGWHY